MACPHLLNRIELEIDKIIAHLDLTFEADRPPPPHIVQQELLIVAESTLNLMIWRFRLIYFSFLALELVDLDVI